MQLVNLSFNDCVQSVFCMQEEMNDAFKFLCSAEVRMKFSIGRFQKRKEDKSDLPCLMAFGEAIIEAKTQFFVKMTFVCRFHKITTFPVV